MAEGEAPFTPEQILGEFRRKYPQYAERTDQELASALSTKYPDSYGKVFGGFLSPRSRQLPEPAATPYPMSDLALDVGKGVLRTALPAGGAILGGMAAGPLAPVGMMTGGAAGDLLAQKMTGGETPGPGAMAMSAITGLLGGLPAKGAGMLERAITPESQLVMGQAARLGIPLNAAENTGRAGLAQAYANIGRYPSTATRVEQFGQRRREAIGQSAESVSPRMPKDLLSAGQGLKESAEELAAAQASASEEAVSRFTRSLGRPAEREEFGEVFQQQMWAINRQRRARASQLYDQAEAELGDRAGPAATLHGIAGAMAEKERALRGVTNPTLANRAGGLAKTTGPDLGPAAADVADLPVNFIHTYGLDQPRDLTFAQMRDIQSRLGGLIQTTRDDYTKNRLGDLHQAITADIRLLANNSPGLAYLHQANNFYGKEVAQHFGRRTPLRGLLDESQVDRVTDKLMTVDSPARVREVMELTSTRPGLGMPSSQAMRVGGANLQDTYRASFMARLHDEGLNPATGQWEPAKFLRATDRYSDDTLKALLGPKFAEFSTLRSTLQKDLQKSSREPIYGQLLKGDEGALPGQLLTFVKNNNHEDVKAVLATLGPKADDAKAAMWTEVMRKSVTPDSGQFSVQRFMTQTKDLDPRTREILLGAAGAQKLGELENVLRRIQTVGSFGLNTSETARGVLGAGQLSGAFDLALRGLTGTLGMRSAMAITGGLLRPNIMAKFLTSEKGIDLLTRGLTVSPGSKQAITLVSELMAFGAKHGITSAE